MTAKEIAEDIMSEIDTRMKPPEDVSMIFETFRDDIRAYAREKCKEQRKLCEESKDIFPNIPITDSPEPEFD